MIIINWLNDNSGFVMALLTFVYVIATILICYFNSKSVKAVNVQTKEAYNHFIENSRALIIPKIIVLEGEMLCLAFQNIGKNIATDVIIDVDEKWLKQMDKTKTFKETSEKLRILKNKKIFLTVEQQLCYGLYIPGNGYNDYEILKENDLIIDISYFTLGNYYEEHYEIPFDGYNFLMNTSDYVRLTKKQINEMKKTNEELKKINQNCKK